MPAVESSRLIFHGRDQIAVILRIGLEVIKVFVLNHHVMQEAEDWVRIL